MRSKKDSVITANMAELKKMVQLVPEDRRSIAESLARELKFMTETLDKLKESIAMIGPVDEFKQGAQHFFRENPALKAYNTTIQRYSLLYKQLADLMPKQQADPTNSALADFLAKNE